VGDARYPNSADKHGHDAIFSPGEVAARLREDGGLVAPDAVLLSHQPILLNELEAP
jgi:hypothetical protein